MRARSNDSIFAFMISPAQSSSQADQNWRRTGSIIAIITAPMALIDNGGAGADGLVLPLLLVPLVALVWNGFVGRVPWAILIPAVAVGPSVLFFFDLAEGGMFFVTVLALLLAIELEEQRVALVLVGLMVLVPLIAGLTVDVEAGWGFWCLGIGLGWAFGRLGRQNRMLVNQLEASRAQVADQAVMAERRRIARDIHDLVGHSITVVLLHVSGARRALRRDPESAEQALKSAEQVGRDSLVEIRRSVGLLRSEDGGETLPSPGSLDIADLIESSRSAGQTIRFEVTGDLANVDGAPGLTAYRIAQEALSNAAKHAVDAPVTVDILVGERECTVVVENAMPDRRALPASVGGGFGLISMRERARAIGGSLVTGPAGNMWRVEANLPLIRPVTTP